MPSSHKLAHYSRSLWLTLGVFVVFAVIFVLYVRSEKQINLANELRIQSHSLSDELRQSSDDLTRMARTYVMTGDPSYREHYHEILDIRDGRKPRPVEYHNIYWDLVLDHESRPRANGQPTPLLLLMQQAGFTRDEFAKLAQAKAISDSLTRIEITAMWMIESAHPATWPVRSKASLMLHDAAYHQAKADIMRPLSELHQMMDQRTQDAVRTAANAATLLLVLFICFGLMLLYMLSRTYRLLHATLGGSVKELHEHIARIGSGDFSFPIAVTAGMERSVLGRLSATQTRLRQINGERAQAKDALKQQLGFARALNKIAESVTSLDAPDLILEETVRTVGEVLEVDRALIYDISFIKHQAIGMSEWLNPAHPDITPTKATYPLDLFIGGASEMRRTRQWLTSSFDNINPHLQEDGSGEILHRQMNIQSLLWYPFVFRQDEYYLLTLNQIHSAREWTQEELDFLDSISRQVSLALNKIKLMDERKQAEERIRHLAYFDALTGLPNRAQLEDHLKYALTLAKRSNGYLALMFLDLDHFKDINDTLGHTIGDTLLVELASRLRLVLREEDTVARLGGDEFILMFPGADARAAAQVAQKLLDVITQSYVIEQYDLTVTASIGIALYPDDGDDLETLSRRADSAMYRVKQEGRNGYRFFTRGMQEKASRNLQLVNALRHALERNELHVHYQPQISMRDQRIVGAEALLRWQHPELGAVSAAEFIPAAEDSGLILPIGEWVLRHAVQQTKSWLENGLTPLVMAVNLSAVQFRHPDLPDMVARILYEFSLPPEYLELELTESVAMHDPQGAIAVMNALHERGVRMSIDDFGTGYSSLSYLKKFKVYKLKIDQSFVRDISTDAEDKAIVSAIIHMARSLGLKTIAEGVETSGQLAFLSEQQCDEVQGYYYSKPLLAEQFEAFVRARKP
jgi:diguanylate cyclase (GGDEF)-like protein